MNPLTCFLYARPDALDGVARTLDLGGTFDEYNTSLTPEQADALAIASDWQVVGDDLEGAIATFAENHRAALDAARRPSRAPDVEIEATCR